MATTAVGIPDETNLGPKLPHIGISTPNYVRRTRTYHKTITSGGGISHLETLGISPTTTRRNPLPTYLQILPSSPNRTPNPW